MPSVCLSSVCHVRRLDQVIAADMSQASAVPHSCEASSPCFVSPLWSAPLWAFSRGSSRQIYPHPDIQHMGLFNELHWKCGWNIGTVQRALGLIQQNLAKSFHNDRFPLSCWKSCCHREIGPLHWQNIYTSEDWLLYRCYIKRSCKRAQIWPTDCIISIFILDQLSKCMERAPDTWADPLNHNVSISHV